MFVNAGTYEVAGTDSIAVGDDANERAARPVTSESVAARVSLDDGSGRRTAFLPDGSSRR
jgi:hypothetical protein